MKTTSLIVVATALLIGCAVQADTTGGSASGANTTLVNVELRDVPIADAIAAIFKGTSYSYYAEPGVSGKIVELKLTGVTLDQALTALTDAADLTYTVEEDGTYVISPKKSAAKIASAQPAAVKTQPVQAQPPPAGSTNPPPADQAASSNSQVMINEQPAPVYYGQPGPGPYSPYGYGYGGYYPPVYQFGTTSVVPGWGGSVVIAGATPYGVGLRYPPPPPPGWVSPDMLKFLRNRYILAPTFGWSPYIW